ncbi:ABC transporter substrate-binding protein [Acetobacteraceae bacterium ESL0709]|nr:ABC transporter substrate-binding protein [Acetobacteraceae bacterium ESL0697]MDF7678743.1 ABC transporter substrate-binding protein [Acetobacteraceae bacterium ESL0709]
MMLRRLSRRTVLGAMSALTLLPGLAMATPATDFVGTFGAELTKILSSPEPLQKKQQEILPLLKKNVDIEAIGRYCLGRYWRVATPSQRERYLKLFDQVLLYAITMQVGNYQNVSLKITGNVPSPAGEKVDILISRPKQPDVTMTVVVEGPPSRVIDLYGEGASMRLTQRSDYTAYLSRHGDDVEALIKALEQQVAQNSARLAKGQP